MSGPEVLGVRAADGCRYCIGGPASALLTFQQAAVQLRQFYGLGRGAARKLLFDAAAKAGAPVPQAELPADTSAAWKRPWTNPT